MARSPREACTAATPCAACTLLGRQEMQALKQFMASFWNFCSLFSASASLAGCTPSSHQQKALHHLPPQEAWTPWHPGCCISRCKQAAGIHKVAQVQAIPSSQAHAPPQQQ